MKENSLKSTVCLRHSSGCRSWLRQFSAVLATLLLPIPVLAHPGHGHGSGYQETDWRSIWHYIVEPEHGLIFVFAVVGLGAFFYVRKRPNAVEVPRPAAAPKATDPTKMQ